MATVGAMAARGYNGALTVRFAATVWTAVGRLSREEFARLQAVIEAHAKALGRQQEPPGSGELEFGGHSVRFEVDRERRLLTVTAVQRAR